MFYATAGPDIALYQVDDAAMALTQQAVVHVPAPVQYIWMHPSKPVLYAAYSDQFVPQSQKLHGVALFHVDRQSGALTPFGEPLRLGARPINITLDRTGRLLLVAYNNPSNITVFRLAADGSVGEEVKQAAHLDPGVYAHQVRVAPSDRFAVLVTRGNDPTPTTKEDAGALKVFRLHDGQLQDEVSVGDGPGFGPRHVDFHPTRPFMYVSMERNNQLLTYGTRRDGITPAPLFTKDTVRQGAAARSPVQYAGPIHVHPNGRFVYVTNRSDSTVDFNGKKVHGEGENSVAVFAINQTSGEPTLIQTIDTQTFHCRTFTIHPAGRMLVTASVAPLAVRDGDAVRTVPAGLTVFRAGADGKLAFVRKYDVDVGAYNLFWCGMVAL